MLTPKSQEALITFALFIGILVAAAGAVTAIALAAKITIKVWEL